MQSELFIAEIDYQICFQQKWKRIMSGAYFTGSGLGIVLGSAATVAAALDYSILASFLAAGATIVYGMEKALLFREKWAHHLSSEMELRSLKIEYISGAVELNQAARRMGEVLRGYAVRLPIAPAREGET